MCVSKLNFKLKSKYISKNNIYIYSKNNIYIYSKNNTNSKNKLYGDIKNAFII